MSVKTTFLLLVVVLCLGAFIFFVEREGSSTEEREAQARRALRIDPGEVTFLRLNSDDLDIECRKEGDAWKITAPINARADGGAIDRILYHLEELEHGEIISVADREERNVSLAEYGFDKPRVRITTGAKGARRTVLVGRDAPLDDAIYIKEENSKDILSVSADLLEIVPERVDDLRDRVLFPGTRAQVRRIGVRREDGFLEIVREENNNWTIQQPLAARADRIEVVKFLDNLFGLRIAEFVADEVGDPAAYGLAGAELQVTLWGDREQGGRTLLVDGSVEGSPELVYAKWEDSDSVYAVSRRAEIQLRVDLNDLRDRNLLPFLPFNIGSIRIEKDERVLELAVQDDKSWLITKPRQHKADIRRVKELVDEWMRVEIEDFVDDASTNLSVYGLKPPAMMVTFADGLGGAEQETGKASAETKNHVSVSLSSMEHSPGRVLVKLGRETSLYEIADDILHTLSVDPLFFRDRVVLGLNRGNIRKITMAEGSRKQAVAYSDTAGAFISLSPKEGEIDQEALEAILEEVSRLAVSGFVADATGDLSQYGLDSPEAVLTFGVTGDTGISKAILFGAAAGDEVYAMIRGQDVVFKLDENQAEILTRGICLTPSAAEKETGDGGTDKTQE